MTTTTSATFPTPTPAPAPAAPTSTANNITDPNAALNSLSSNFTNFLQLFLAQLKNQDPTAPLDTNQLTSELAQFAQVEQTVATNTNLQTLINQNQGSQISSAGSYIGSTITADGTNLQLVNGTADLSYIAGTGMTAATITISDSTGKVVYTNTVDAGAGQHDITWPGIDSAGNQLADGTYSVQVSQTDANNTSTNAETIVSGIVQSVNIQNGAVTLKLNTGTSVDASKVLSVVKTSANAA